MKFIYTPLNIELSLYTDTKHIRFYEWRNEYWRPVYEPNYPYLVSSFGRVKSLPRLVNNRFRHYFQETKLMSVFETKGYFRTSLRMKNEDGSSGLAKKFFIHILVAKSFMINHFNKKVVNHKDLNKQNNHISNLEFATAAENTRHYFLSEKSNKKSKYMGVVWVSKKQRWQVKIYIDGNFKYKNFVCEQDAADYLTSPHKVLNKNISFTD